MVLQTSEIRSTRRRRSQRHPVITSAEPYRSNTLHPSRRPSVGRLHHLPSPQMPHQKLVLSNGWLQSPRTQPQMATSQPPVQGRPALLVLQHRQQLLLRCDQAVKLRGQSPITHLSVPHPQQQHGLRQEAHLADRGCHREATPTRSQQQLRSLRPTLKGDSRSLRARTTLSLRHTLNRSPRAWASQALVSQVHNECSQHRLVQLVDTPRVATSGLTLSPRLLVA